MVNSSKSMIFLQKMVFDPQSIVLKKHMLKNKISYLKRVDVVIKKKKKTNRLFRLKDLNEAQFVILLILTQQLKEFIV